MAADVLALVELYFKICCIIFMTTSLPTHLAQESCGPTPRSLNQSFLMECNRATDGTVCERMLATFRDAVVGKPYHSIMPSSYRPLLTAFPIEARENQMLIGLEESRLVGRPGQVDENVEEVLFSVASLNVSFVSLTNVPLSRIVGAIWESAMDVSWCSNTSLGNFLYERNCPCNNSENFWVEFHATLTEASTGIITYVTDGEKPGGAFRSDSFFSEHVIPRLNSQMVSRIVAIVVHREGVGESCSQMCGTLRTLRQVVEMNSMRFDCHDITGHVRSNSTRTKLANCLAELLKVIQSGQTVNANTPVCTSILPGIGSRGFYLSSATISLLFSLSFSSLT